SGISSGLRWTFAPAVGGGICSMVYVLFRRPMFGIELAMLAGLAMTYRFVRRPVPASSVSRPYSISPWWLLLALGCGFALSQCLSVIERAPHGDWDATAIWNSHARYLFRDGPAWQSHIQNTSHADYPLLVPAVVARLWRYIGSDIPDAASVPG